MDAPCAQLGQKIPIKFKFNQKNGCLKYLFFSPHCVCPIWYIFQVFKKSRDDADVTTLLAWQFLPNQSSLQSSPCESQAVPFSNIYIAVTFTARPVQKSTAKNIWMIYLHSAAIKRHGRHSHLVMEDNMTDCLKMKQWRQI